MTINGEDHGVLGVPLVTSHEAEEAVRRGTMGCVALVICAVGAAILTASCCGGAVLIWRLS